MQIVNCNIEKITQSGMLRANSLSISEKSIQPFSRTERSPFSSSHISRTRATISSYSSIQKNFRLPLSAISANHSPEILLIFCR